MKKQCSTCAKRFTCPFFQKGLEEWERFENDPNRCWLLEKELEVIP